MKKKLVLLLLVCSFLIGCTEWHYSQYPATARVIENAVTDIDGNRYDAVQIGNQVWMAENLRTTRYADGTRIDLGEKMSDEIPYRYCPKNYEATVPMYGYLYNWAAVTGGEGGCDDNPSCVQGICPDGWHVPSDAEWEELDAYVATQSDYLNDANCYSMAKAIASREGWNSTSIPCTAGNNMGANNSTGFSARPAGAYNGNSIGFGDGAFFWTVTEYQYSSAYYRGLICNDANIYEGYYDEKCKGLSVRCVRN